MGSLPEQVRIWESRLACGNRFQVSTHDLECVERVSCSSKLQVTSATFRMFSSRLAIFGEQLRAASMGTVLLNAKARMQPR